MSLVFCILGIFYSVVILKRRVLFWEGISCGARFFDYSIFIILATYLFSALLPRTFEMAEKLEDLNLPNASVQKIIKEAIPDSVNIGKDARSALSRAASVFVLYVTSQASKEAQKGNRKTLLGQDVLRALEEIEFQEFLEPLQDLLKGFKDTKKKPVKDKKSNQDVEMTETDENEENADDHVEDEEAEET